MIIIIICRPTLWSSQGPEPPGVHRLPAAAAGAPGAEYII